MSSNGVWIVFITFGCVETTSLCMKTLATIIASAYVDVNLLW